MAKKSKIEGGQRDMGLANIADDREALLAFMDERANAMHRLKEQIFILENKLVEEEKLMKDAKSKFASLKRCENCIVSNAKVGRKTKSLLGIEEFWTVGSETATTRENYTPHQGGQTSKKPLIMLPPPFKRKVYASMRSEENGMKAQSTSCRELVVAKEGRDNYNSDIATPEAKRFPMASKSRDNRTNKTDAKPRIIGSSGNPQGGLKGTYELKGHDDLIKLIGRSSSRVTIEGHTEDMIASNHEKRLRNLAICSSNPKFFATSALDGTVRFWQLQSDGCSASILKAVNAMWPDKKRWAEDLAWHPHRTTLFSVYPADDGYPQISVLDLNEAERNCKLDFLEDKAHTKGLINRIMFTPWDDPCFVTGGSDHAVVLWKEDHGNMWKPRLLHKDFHSSAVMGVAGIRHNNLVLSCGDDKKVLGFDVREEKLEFKHRLDSKCTSVLPNPRDSNLVMIHTRQLERQLRLYDIRLPHTELLCFGWKQQDSELQSALINQSWSPDGLYISSGSADPIIHIFDIRYNASVPSYSMRAHKRRVFKAEWHPSLALLISISSDLHIGFHKLR